MQSLLQKGVMSVGRNKWYEKESPVMEEMNLPPERRLRLCVGASAGGHMNQLLRLLDCSKTWAVQPSVYVTTQPELARKLMKKGKTYIIGECNRHHPFGAMMILARSFKIIWREKPDVIVTTGSMPLAMLCLAAKLWRKKVIWIDSIANTERFSVSGRLMYYFADMFLAQWPHLAEKRARAEFVGAIL